MVSLTDQIKDNLNITINNGCEGLKYLGENKNPWIHTDVKKNKWMNPLGEEKAASCRKLLQMNIEEIRKSLLGSHEIVMIQSCECNN